MKITLPFTTRLYSSKLNPWCMSKTDHYFELHLKPEQRDYLRTFLISEEKTKGMPQFSEASRQ